MRDKLLDSIYPHANTVACIEDSKLLKQFQYDILYHKAGLGATLDELNSINYFHTYKNADGSNYREMLDGLMKATFDQMREIAPDDLIWRIFSLYYDIHNMKLVVKERFFGKRLDNLALGYGGYTLPTIRSAAVGESDNILENETLTKGFFEALRAEDIYFVDFILDRTYCKTLRKFAEELGNPSILAFIIEKIDLYNVSAYYQSLAAGSPAGFFPRTFSEYGSLPLSEWMQPAGDSDSGPGRTDGLRGLQQYKTLWEGAADEAQLFSELDVLIDNYLIEKTKICKLMAFGMEPICAYYFNKLMEIKNIRILLTGKENGYHTGEIRKRMRKPYEL